MKQDNIRRILDTLCWNMEWHDKEDDIRDAILAIEVLMLDERIEGGLRELEELEKKYNSKPKDEWFRDPLPRAIQRLKDIYTGDGDKHE